VRGGNLRVANGAGDLGHAGLVIGVQICVQKGYGNRAQPRVITRLQGGACGLFVQRRDHTAIGIKAFGNLGHLFVQKIGPLDMKGKQIGSGLIADPQKVAEPFGHKKQNPLAFALQKRVGGNGRAHFNGANAALGNRVVKAQAKQIANALFRRIDIALGIVGEQLMGVQCPIRCASDDIGKRAAAINPKLPLCRAHPSKSRPDCRP